ncbi:MAG TPA: DUF4340 domain-containing protein [Leucothrix mucor]|nr:DUF4340 domain-containing protein [Leucothrix mucor]
MKIINKRWLLNALLLLLVLGLSWFIVQRLNPPRETLESLYDEAMGDEIVSIHIYRQDPESNIASTLELKKISGKWMMTSPLQAELDGRKVQHLTTLLTDTVDASYTIKGKDLSIFGLETERVSIAFNGVKIQFGSLNPVTHKRYLRKGQTIYIVSETIYGLLLNNAGSFLQKNSN